KIYRLLEAYIRYLPIEEKIAYLTRFGDKAKIEELSEADGQAAHLLEFHRQLERHAVQLDPETAQEIAEKLKSHLLAKEAERKREPVDDLLALQVRDELNPLTTENVPAFLKRFRKLYPAPS